MDAKYLELAKRIGLGHTQRIPRLFAMIAEPDEADLLLSLPGDAAAMSGKLGLTEGEAAARLERLFHKGLVFPSSKTDPPTYRMCRDLIQFHDATILWPEAPREFLDLWQEFMETEWPDVARFVSQMTPRTVTRVIPVGAAVTATSHVLAYEDIKTIIDKAETLAVTNCTCRTIAHKCDRPLETCLQINNAAQYSLARGTGRRLTREEALDLMKKAEEAGLIHVVMNKRSVDHFICNCCPCCCQTMPVLIKHGVAVIEPSRFRSQIDPELCIGCEACVEQCYFGAIAMVPDDDRDTGQYAGVNPEKCLGCGLCQVACPSGAVSMEAVRPADYVPEKLFG